ncbi:hypothetical protein [Oerskovia flava]|uniref:hypothetical protein n=1 Tax=Oerskovia flava TaxID=2986422 RepID=UPI002240258D|nr:hypothetical protein [Oerskovia sp. JB1-3-2]
MKTPARDDDTPAAPSPPTPVVVPATGLHVSASLSRPRASIALEHSHQRRVRRAEQAYESARASGNPVWMTEAMAALDDARTGAGLWRR